MKKIMLIMVLLGAQGLVAGDEPADLVYYIQPGANYDQAVQGFITFVNKEIRKKGKKPINILRGDSSADIRTSNSTLNREQLRNYERTVAVTDLVKWINCNVDFLKNLDIYPIDLKFADPKPSALSKIANFFNKKKTTRA